LLTAAVAIAIALGLYFDPSARASVVSDLARAASSASTFLDATIRDWR
jgi:hypothetical protein